MVPSTVARQAASNMAARYGVSVSVSVSVLVGCPCAVRGALMDVVGRSGAMPAGGSLMNVVGYWLMVCVGWGEGLAEGERGEEVLIALVDRGGWYGGCRVLCGQYGGGDGMCGGGAAELGCE